jgi:hypothetical protein
VERMILIYTAHIITITPERISKNKNEAREKRNNIKKDKNLENVRCFANQRFVF